MIDYAGAIHFHSAYSYDAWTPVETIVKAALATDLDFAILTDHFKLTARQDGWEKWHGDTHRKLLFIVGEEISPRYNHYLAFNLKEPIVVEKTRPAAQPFIDAVNAREGFGFIAHPDHEGAPLAGVRAYPWIDWNATGFTGLSVWDLMGDWSSALTSPWAMLKASLSPAKALRGPLRKTLERWDALNRAGRYVALGEVDNHANRKTFWGISRRIFPWDFAFKTIRTHVLLEQPLAADSASAIGQVHDALRQGRSYISLDYWHSPRGFLFNIYDAETRADIGGTFHKKGAALIEVKAPGPGRIHLFRDGREVFVEHRRPQMERDLEFPGVYRVEVEQFAAGRWRPWIISNPIWVK